MQNQLSNLVENGGSLQKPVLGTALSKYLPIHRNTVYQHRYSKICALNKKLEVAASYSSTLDIRGPGYLPSQGSQGSQGKSQGIHFIP